MEIKAVPRMSRVKTRFLAATTVLLIASAAPSFAQDAAHPGTEAAVRQQIEGWEKKAPVTDDMTPQLAAATHQQQANIQNEIDSLGALQSLTFLRNENGADVFVAQFEHGKTAWTIAPLADGKISGLLVQAVYARAGDGPSPGAEDALRQTIDALGKGAPAYDIMGPALADATRTQLPFLKQTADSLGSLKTLTFQSQNPQGWDIYLANYEHGTAQWRVTPLKDGKLEGLLMTDINLADAKPHPGTEASLRRYIESVQNGQPNYDEMVPALADSVRAQLPQISALLKSWGALQTITFKGGGPQDVDIYEVTFEHGKAQWVVGPLTADGKVARRGFRPLS